MVKMIFSTKTIMVIQKWSNQHYRRL